MYFIGCVSLFFQFYTVAIGTIDVVPRSDGSLVQSLPLRVVSISSEVCGNRKLEFLLDSFTLRDLQYVEKKL